MVKTNNTLISRSNKALSERELLISLVENNSYLNLKYSLEPIVATIILIASLPILCAIYISILLFDRHNPLFIQERPGKNSSSFYILKFRTMKKNRNSSYKQSDNEITSLGRILRKWKLDELPQLLNVITGEMSLIGPRPEPIEYFMDIINKHPNYRYKYFVKPGLTGLAQLEYYKSTATVEGAMEKFSYDIAYMMDINFKDDLKLFFKTAGVVFKKNLG